MQLVEAREPHWQWIAAELAAGAREGCFERELADDTDAARLFFANLRNALRTGSFAIGHEDGHFLGVPAGGYVYVDDGHPHEPLGFVLFKSVGSLGFELWLTAMTREWRGYGHGKAMIQAALGTPAGRVAHLVRVNRESSSAHVMHALLCACSYEVAREGAEVRWFLRRDASEALRCAVCGGRTAQVVATSKFSPR